MNNLFNQLMGTNTPPVTNDMVSKFNAFKSTIQGDPKAMVQSLLNSGQMSQEQYNMLSNMASQLQKTLH